MVFVLDRPRSAPTRRESRHERRRLAELDRLGARLGDLARIRAVVAGAGEVVASGWLQRAWFACPGPRGGERLVTPQRLAGRPVTGACLVGAVVQAGGGPGGADAQPVARALDLLWHALHRDPDEPVRWCPGPPVRAQHVRDLTAWNDAPGRTAADVARLLTTADAIAATEADRARRARTALAGGS